MMWERRASRKVKQIEGGRGVYVCVQKQNLKDRKAETVSKMQKGDMIIYIAASQAYTRHQSFSFYIPIPFHWLPQGLAISTHPTQAKVGSEKILKWDDITKCVPQVDN